MKKFIYDVHNHDNDIIQIHDYDKEIAKKLKGRLLFTEDELEQYLKTYKNCISLPLSKAADIESRRLQEKYNLATALDLPIEN